MGREDEFGGDVDIVVAFKKPRGGCGGGDKQRALRKQVLVVEQEPPIAPLQPETEGSSQHVQRVYRVSRRASCNLTRSLTFLNPS